MDSCYLAGILAVAILSAVGGYFYGVFSAAEASPSVFMRLLKQFVQQQYDDGHLTQKAVDRMREDVRRGVKWKLRPEDQP